MKRILLLFLLASASIYSGCKKEENNDVKPISVSLQVSLDQTLASYNFPMGNTEIKLTNLINGQVNTAKTDATGKINFENIMPGNYDIQATLKISAADYSTITGTVQTSEVSFGGLLKAQSLTSNNTSLALQIKTGRIGDWLFKQIYYAGSHTNNGAIFRDGFIELYNNSNEVLYADSLYFGQIFGINKKSADVDLSQSYFRSDRQFDWSKSIGNNISRANEDYIYAKTLYMIPGTGKQHPVQPGESIIIASTAINHKSPYTDLEGKSVSVKDPSLTVDLSKADFEVYLGDVPGINPLGSDINNPAVPNMVLLNRGGDRDLILQSGGRDAYAIFKTNEDVKAYGKVPTPDIAELITTTDLYIRIPTNVVIDAVETQPPVSSSQFPKKLQSNLDASYKFVSKGAYSSQSLIRKTAKTINGRRILKDTNNSSEDFDELERADVSKTVFK